MRHFFGLHFTLNYHFLRQTNIRKYGVNGRRRQQEIGSVWSGLWALSIHWPLLNNNANDNNGEWKEIHHANCSMSWCCQLSVPFLSDWRNTSQQKNPRSLWPKYSLLENKKSSRITIVNERSTHSTSSTRNLMIGDNILTQNSKMYMMFGCHTFREVINLISLKLRLQ